MPATSSRKDAFRMRFLPVFLLGLLAAPATAMAAEEGGGGTDYTTQIMLALVIVLMILMVVIGALETRKPH